MFCTKCGSKVDQDSKFCHFCGQSISGTTTITTEPKVNNTTMAVESSMEGNTVPRRSMTYEEYVADIDIKSADEAQMYLKNVKGLFWAVFISYIVVQGLVNSSSESAVAGLFWPFYIGLLIYFVYYCYKILKKEKLSGANAALCIIFAPLSWIALYPMITDPLKIITGKKMLPLYMTEEEKKKKKIKDEKASKRNVLILLGIIVLIIIIFIIAMNN